jgi:hypothetical protein
MTGAETARGELLRAAETESSVYFAYSLLIYFCRAQFGRAWATKHFAGFVEIYFHNGHLFREPL